VDGVRCAGEVAAALAAGRPVVALETAVLTHGLPRPWNLEAVRAMATAVREGGAVPAVVAVLGGVLQVGLDEEELAALAQTPEPDKLGARDLARALALGRTGGTTVSGTLAACRLAGVRVFATGGIGGVHRGWTARPDVSSDLGELARTPCCVVSSGAKSVLDLPATLEALEALGVPVLGWGTAAFPASHTPGAPALAVPEVADAATVAELCRRRWEELRQGGGVLLANPVPAAAALDRGEVEAAVDRAEAEARRQGVTGPALTPFLLDALAGTTGGRSVQANLALLASNAALAARVAVALAAPVRG